MKCGGVRMESPPPLQQRETKACDLSTGGFNFREGCRMQELGCRFISQNVLLVVRKSTPPQNSQLITLIRNSKQHVDDFVGELTF